MRHNLPAGLLLGCTAAFLGSCSLTGDSPWSGARAEVFAAGAYGGLDGTVRTKAAAGKAEFDLADNGGQDSQFNAYAGGRIGFSPFDVGVTLLDSSDTATGRYNGTFLGTNFAGRVTSKYEFRAIQGTLGVDLFQNDSLRFGLLGGLDVIDLGIELSDASAAGLGTERLDETLPVPVVGLRGDLALYDDLTVGATVVGLDVTVDRFEISLLDWEIGLRYYPWEHVAAFLGYRDLQFDFDGRSGKSDVGAELSHAGPFFGVALSF